jgi:ABC-type transport system substrate-binding protein
VAALFASTALIAAACGSSGGGGASSGSTTGTSGTSGGTTGSSAASSTPGTQAHSGGTITVGVEQEMDCADWMGSCGGSTYGAWSLQQQTMPKPFDFVPDGDNWVYKADSMLTGEPTIVTSPKQVVTYKISPQAVWSDGQPITSEDFKYTWQQIVTGKDIYSTTGYTTIGSLGILEEPVRRLRRLPLAHPAGQGPRCRDEGWLHLVRWPVDDDGLEQGRRHDARAQPEVLGSEAARRQGGGEVLRGHRG